MRGEAGVSLVEVLVAASLIGLAVVPLLQLYPAVLDADREAETRMRLGTVAGRRMEEIIHRLRDDIGAVSSGGDSCDADLPSCRVEWVVAAETSSATPGVGMLVAVTVIACLDSDGDLGCDATEQQTQYDAKVTSRP